MIDVQMIRSSILSHAFQGKLAKAEYDLSANTTLDELHRSNSRYEPVANNEKLIDAPPHWAWTRLGYVTSNHGQETPSETFCYIDVGTLDNIRHQLSDNENVVEASHAPSRAKKLVEPGDVLYSTVRPYLHNICIIDRDFTYKPIASTAFCVMKANEEVLLNRYLFYWLLTNEFDKYANGNPSKGALYPAIGEKALLHGVIPLPSLNEQELIVSIIDECFYELDQIEDSLNRYTTDISILERMIIEAGIKGDLTEQAPDDGNASDLIELITAKRKELQAAKVLRKNKALPAITKEEIPFDIPSSWMWVRTGDIFDVGTGVTPLTSEKKYYEGGTVPWIGSALTANRYITESEKYVTEYAMEHTNLRLYPPHTLIVALYGEGKTRGQVSELLISAATNQACAALNSIYYDQATVEYTYYVYKYNYETLRQKAIGTNQSNLNLQKIKETLIPLPPLSEQRRIVQRLNELLGDIPQ